MLTLSQIQTLKKCWGFLPFLKQNYMYIKDHHYQERTALTRLRVTKCSWQYLPSSNQQIELKKNPTTKQQKTTH